MQRARLLAAVPIFALVVVLHLPSLFAGMAWKIRPAGREAETA